LVWFRLERWLFDLETGWRQDPFRIADSNWHLNDPQSISVNCQLATAKKSFREISVTFSDLSRAVPSGEGEFDVVN
jgi:hypothetical protein